MNCWIVNVASVEVVGRLKCDKRRRIKSDGLCGGLPSRVLVASSEVAVQLKDWHKGGIVNGVPCAEPKCLVFRSKSSLLTSSGSVTVFHSLDCFGGRLSFGISRCVTRLCDDGLTRCLIFE